MNLSARQDQRLRTQERSTGYLVRGIYCSHIHPGCLAERLKAFVKQWEWGSEQWVDVIASLGKEGGVVHSPKREINETSKQVSERW
ncbi:hypothetical protein HZA86_01845 [Candidatus Uhrbacteria bacterium]|nr:hypothetical protein [Candidatus Uhrbacteria bacterium]